MTLENLKKRIAILERITSHPDNPVLTMSDRELLDEARAILHRRGYEDAYTRTPYELLELVKRELEKESTA